VVIPLQVYDAPYHASTRIFAVTQLS